MAKFSCLKFMMKAQLIVKYKSGNYSAKAGTSAVWIIHIIQKPMPSFQAIGTNKGGTGEMKFQI